MACEAALHHLFFSRKAIKSNGLLKTNPPLRREEDRVALVEGLRGGDVDFLVTDHAPHTMQEKVVEGMSGVPGLDDYGHLVSWLMKSQSFEPRRIARVCSSNPASFYGLRDRGEISVGKRADMSILDLRSSEKVTAETVMSKCGWSPYEGTEFPGRVKWTIVGGKARLDEYELVR
jgi:dihydroorotase